MTQKNNESLQIQEINGLKPKHFADLIRAAQLVFDPSGGISGRNARVNWEELGIPIDVTDNLKSLGDKYRYASPHISIEIVWEQLTSETRSWFIENKDDLWQIEEAFPALDED